MAPVGEEPSRRRLVVGISGASGAAYGIRLLEILRTLEIETHLVLTRSAELTIAYETDLKTTDVKAMADVCHPVKDLGAAISSGSFRTLGMVVGPCSVRCVSAIVTGPTADLRTRGAAATPQGP